MQSSKYAAYDETGTIIGFYDSKDSPVPAGVKAIKITHAEWEQTIHGEQGWTVMNGKLTPPSLEHKLKCAKSRQVASLRREYRQHMNVEVEFTTSYGVTALYRFGTTRTPSGANAHDLLKSIVQQGSSCWTNGHWFDRDNTPRVFSFEDLVRLLDSLDGVHIQSEHHLTSKIVEVHAATTLEDVEKVKLIG